MSQCGQRNRTPPAPTAWNPKPKFYRFLVSCHQWYAECQLLQLRVSFSMHRPRRIQCSNSKLLLCCLFTAFFFFRNSWNLRHTKRVLIMFEGLKNWKEKPCYSIYSQMPEKWGTASSCMMMGTCVEESSPQPDACHIAEKSAQDPKHSFIT